ncbi:MAG: peptidase M23 [Ruminococcaceae bacterium]|nr:peptidase M23 [Oscillospiraceae bacterium]
MKQKRVLRALLAAACLIALLLSGAAPLSVVPDARAVTQAEIDAKKQEKKGLEAQKAELQAQLKALQRDKSDALAQKENLDTQIAVIRSEIANTEEQITQYEQLIEQTRQELAETQQRHEEQYELFCARVRAMEERGTVSYWSVLFRSTSFSDLLASMDFINEIMESDQRVIEDLQATEAQLAEEQQALEEQLAEQEAVREELSARNRELNDQLEAARQLISSLAADEEEYKRLVAEKEAAAEREQQEIVRLSRELAEQQAREAAERAAREAAERAQREQQQGQPQETPQQQTPQQQDTGAALGGYIWPCSSHYVTSPLGARYTGIAGASTNHAGIDIGRVGYDTQAVAAKAGTVIISDYNKYRGNYVVVSHGSGNTTTYQHLSKRSVSVGDYVQQGQVVGITGSTGVSSGPHLHFEITENGEIVNPLNYLTNYIKGW